MVDGSTWASLSLSTDSLLLSSFLYLEKLRARLDEFKWTLVWSLERSTVGIPANEDKFGLLQVVRYRRGNCTMLRGWSRLKRLGCVYETTVGRN